MQAIYLRDGYSGKGRGLEGWYRDLTVREAKEGRFRSLYAMDYSGKVREIRLNGKVKVWKTWPGCELSLKYGLRDCFRVGGKERTDDQAVSNHTRILVPVQHAFNADTPPGIVTDYVTDHELS